MVMVGTSWASDGPTATAITTNISANKRNFM